MYMYIHITVTYIKLLNSNREKPTLGAGTPEPPASLRPEADFRRQSRAERRVGWECPKIWAPVLYLVYNGYGRILQLHQVSLAVLTWLSEGGPFSCSLPKPNGYS